MLPVEPISYPACLAGQSNGELELALLWSTPGLAGGPMVRLVEPAARSWRAMTAAALGAGHALKATSSADSYRTLPQQITTFTNRYQLEPTPWGYRWWDSDGNGVRERWYRKTSSTAPAAVPGTSNHGWGLAVDTGEERDGDTGTESLDQATLDWLVANERRFGFSHELQVEPWHIRYWAGDAIPQAVLDYEEAQMGLEEWTIAPDTAKPWALTQGNPGYAGEQRDTGLAFAWQHAKEANDKATKALTVLAAVQSTLAQILALLQAGGGQPPSGPVDLSDDALAEVRELVDEELDEQSRGGADADQ